ncbi:unnamed protein product : Uncharacterized protein OS=Desulfovibrio aespoeensis (strain ATCC 700646 / DSM 10631 / Aspo-2) GN=Daes_1584 PE=4 SV=1: QueC [Gemmataceae bacterium]|nr:unnamed protein product : Uncharacterized protein OS=Desulfovibrio aespoeensis (strain ATCC 700646 / DSM 10631 / Aspo-2) GN=Daes_1584 PE=4 SV=1: QueC [Gemmataceae bacterium]VTU02517.1 unnamed protein product : Uncharacterized protein OS=Desulfovibrio aespoeensis (strain ATCC 700646 / DSM 10631 / Aspo-2) GN=Daes_1584 PE=4 SV=1: QueC [Gemmataceae bacterium]
MSDPHLVLCGGLPLAAAPPRWRRLPRTDLDIGGAEDVHLAVAQLTARMAATIPDASMDLLEVAAYVFAADQALTRGGTAAVDYGDAWRRRLRFVIPVRDPERWGRADVQLALRAALEFLTDDEYEFAFVRATEPARPERYLTDLLPPSGTEFEEVVLFSGGLDSLCGAVEEVLVAGRRAVLVSHRSATRVTGRQREVFEALAARAPDPRRRPLHVGVTVNKASDLNREFTQRSRSFVFASVAAVVARQVGLGRVTFFENGCTSLNLPVSPELVGARASRTTHPQSLARFGTFLTHLFGTRFAVRNPYQSYTKAEILTRLRERGHAALCRLTCSCGTVWGRDGDRPHCGVCSQCVERRVSALAAGLTDADDPPDRYACDPIRGDREGPDLTFAERYVGTAREVAAIDSPLAFAARFPEVNEAAPFLAERPGAGVRLAHGLCQRNARGIMDVIRRAVDPEELVGQSVAARSLLGAALGRTVGPRATTPAPPAASRDFCVVRETFSVTYDGHSCDLGNTLEFRFVERLHRARGTYLPIPVIGKDVWDDEAVSKNAVQAVASNLRRKLRRLELPEDFVDGSQKGHYGLRLLPT